MAYRRNPLVTGEIYHVFNRSIAKEPIFHKYYDYQRFYDTTDFYRFNYVGFRFSHFNRLNISDKTNFLRDLYKDDKKNVEILAFSYMPNHYHYLLRQMRDNGIRIFISKIQNSYAKYYDTKFERTGSLFQTTFKAVRIESEEQLLHVSRYIHLNPITSFLLKNISELEKYSWTSFPDYLSIKQNRFVTRNLISSYFKTPEELVEFTSNQIDYQRMLNQIKHLIIE